MSAEEINVLRYETEFDSSMPAWKKEILERRKAKSKSTFDSFSGAFAARLNDEVQGENGRSEKSRAFLNGNITVTSASRHFAGKRAFSPVLLSPLKTSNEQWSPFDHCDITTPDKNVCCHSEGESLVLSDSLGPLHDNPFIKMERQRKKLQDQEKATRSIQHILEVYGGVPGVRTIRAENIIIIESDPDFLLEPSGFKTGTKLRHNGRSSSVKDLMDQNCTAVTEIHAKEVVIYNSKLSRSEENLSTLGHFGAGVELAHVQGEGRVSRMLQKFDCNYDKLQPRSRSSESLLDANSSSDRLGLRPKPQPDPVPKSVTPPRSAVTPLSPALSQKRPHAHLVFQSSESSVCPSQTQPSPEQQEGVVPFPVPPQAVGQGEPKAPVNLSSQTQTLSGKGRDLPDQSSRRKVPSSLERRGDVGPSCRLAPRSSAFEIRPSPRPDLSTLPPDDVQARALANLRLQSRNSFTVIPKRRMPTAVPASSLHPPPSLCPQATAMPKPAPPAPTPPSPSPPEIQEERVPRPALTEPSQLDGPVTPCTPLSPTTTAPTPGTPPSGPLALPPLTPDPHTPGPLTPPPHTPSPQTPGPRTPTLHTPGPLTPPPHTPAPPPEEPPCADQLPITNIDDVVVERMRGAPSSAVLQRKGNTFTVVPKRRPDPQETPEPQGPAPAPKQAPYAELGSLLKKRYPKAEEIEVIGGYLSLSRSCLSKNPTRKKLKISFNESSLHSTFEYPSESSLTDGGVMENEEEEEEEGIMRFRIPRPSYTGSPNNTSSSIDLSSYTPKFAVDFSAWQEQKNNVHAFPGDSNTECAEQSLQEVMLTPAERPPLSDFLSDPALYF